MKSEDIIGGTRWWRSVALDQRDLVGLYRRSRSVMYFGAWAMMG